MIRSANQQDLPVIVKIHQAALAQTIISKMGRPVLTSLYKSLLKQEGAGVYVYEKKGVVVGVASWAKNYSLELDEQARKTLVKQMIVKPLMWPSIFERALMGQYIKLHFGFEPWLLTLAVEEDQRGKGIGTKLINTVFFEARKLGERTLMVETLTKKANVVKFYEKLGFTKIKCIGPNTVFRKLL